MKALLHKNPLPDASARRLSAGGEPPLFISYRLGLGRRSAATEYVYHLPRLAKAGDTAIDIGANLGYYARPLSEIVGTAGRGPCRRTRPGRLPGAAPQPAGLPQRRNLRLRAGSRE